MFFKKKKYISEYALIYNSLFILNQYMFAVYSKNEEYSQLDKLVYEMTKNLGLDDENLEQAIINGIQKSISAIFKSYEEDDFCKKQMHIENFPEKLLKQSCRRYLWGYANYDFGGNKRSIDDLKSLKKFNSKPLADISNTIFLHILRQESLRNIISEPPKEYDPFGEF